MKTEIEQNAKEINRILNTTVKNTSILFEELALSLIQENLFYCNDTVEEIIYKRATEEPQHEKIIIIIANVISFLATYFKEKKYLKIILFSEHPSLTGFIISDYYLSKAYATHLIDYTDI